MAHSPDPFLTRVDEVGQLNAHTHAARAAVLLVNLGTPEAPTARALRPYLREFLSDPRVIEAPRLRWWFVLNGLIVPFRSPRSARAYQRIWTEEGSPLLIGSRKLATALDRELKKTLPRVEVLLAMNYGQPDMDSVLDRLRRENIQRLLVLPLYPQYSATTTASVFDRLTASMRRLRWLPELRFINDYHDHEAWLDAVAASIRDFRKNRPPVDKLLFSFHGIPKDYVLKGDPYYCQSQASARRIAERLGLADEEWMVSFQSRLGRAEWLRPYTDETLEQLARQGVRRLQVVCPGFSIDCLETTDEIAYEGREEFIAAGGESLEYIPALNDSVDHVRVLSALVHEHSQGWPEFSGARATAESALEARQERAMAAARKLGLD